MITEELFQRVKENSLVLKKGPYCIDLIMSDSCNLNCQYCSGGIDYERQNFLSKDSLIKLFDAAEALCVREISLTSLIGEPTLFKDIRFVMREIKKRNFIGSLLTNGTSLDKDFAQFVKEIEWDVLILSLDSFYPKIQYKLRPSLHKQNYLPKIIDFLQVTSETNESLCLNLNMVVSRVNYTYIEDYFRQAENYGVNNITLLKLLEMNKKYKKFILSDRKQKYFIKMLQNIKTTIPFNRLEWLEGRSFAPASERSIQGSSRISGKCYYHLYKILINYDGQVLKCNGEGYKKTKFNIKDSSLRDIYFELLKNYAYLRNNPNCYDGFFSPIKPINH